MDVYFHDCFFISLFLFSLYDSVNDESDVAEEDAFAFRLHVVAVELFGEVVDVFIDAVDTAAGFV